MYTDISPEYLGAINDVATKRRLLGTIGITPFTGNDVIRNSFEVQNRCAEESDTKIGGVYVGQLNMVFVPSFLSKVPKKSYIGQEITPYIGLYVPEREEWEDVPLGVFTIESAKISKEGITIEAYDHMKKLDKPFDLGNSSLSSTPYGFLKLISLECGVELGMTKSMVEELPNGVDELYLVEENDIETYRDVLYWIAQTLGCFATMDREGKLVVREFLGGTTIMSEKHRDVDAVYSDYKTKWTAITMYDIDAGEDQYYSVKPDDGLTMHLGSNPFLQTVSDKTIQQAITFLELEIERVGDEITALETELGLLENAIENVEEALEEHPDDPDLIALHERLLAEKTVLENDIHFKEEEKTDLEVELEQARAGLIDASKVFKKKAREAILKAVNAIQYSPFYVNSARDPIFDLGDRVVFEGGMAQGEEGCIMSLSYRLDNFCFEGYGDDPALTNSRSKTDKSVTGAKRSKSKEDKINVDFATFINADDITIGAGQEEEVGYIRFGVANTTDVESWIEIKLDATLIDGKAGVMMTYYFDNEEIIEYHPVEEWRGAAVTLDLDDTTMVYDSSPEGIATSTHTIGFHYHFMNVDPEREHTITYKLKSLDGEEYIDVGCVHATVWAEGLLNEDKFTGTIRATDEIPMYEFGTLELLDDIDEDVTVGGIVPPVTEYLVTEDGDYLVTEDGDRLIT